MIRKGAFARAVEAGAKGLPLLWQHQQSAPIGRIESIAEDARGSIFTPKGAVGARLDSLVVQSSSYGSDLPKLFGTMRVAGSVIWSTDLQESKHKSSAGKGQLKTTSYSYAASFAVALSARPILTVHRIWADGSLLRGAAGDWKGDVGAFRVYLGDEGQAIDPLIGSAQGIATTPAQRGLAYVVFEQLQLATMATASCR